MTSKASEFSTGSSPLLRPQRTRLILQMPEWGKLHQILCSPFWGNFSGIWTPEILVVLQISTFSNGYPLLLSDSLALLDEEQVPRSWLPPLEMEFLLCHVKSSRTKAQNLTFSFHFLSNCIYFKINLGTNCCKHASIMHVIPDNVRGHELPTSAECLGANLNCYTQIRDWNSASTFTIYQMGIIVLPITQRTVRIYVKHLKVFRNVLSTIGSKNSTDISKLRIIIIKTNINVSSIFHTMHS